MKNQISNILKKYVDEFAFVSTNEYIQTRSSLQKEDVFNDYSKFDGFKTIITLGIGYPSKTISNKDKTIGLLSRYSYGTDYHIVFRKILSEVET